MDVSKLCELIDLIILIRETNELIWVNRIYLYETKSITNIWKVETNPK